MAETKAEIFSDIDLSFIANPLTGNVNRKTNRDSVKQSVKSLILTEFYEIPFKSSVGCGTRFFLFELFTPSVRQQMEAAIRETIRNHEPRAEVIEVLVEEHQDGHALTVSLAFFIKNDPNPVILDTILTRVR
jgi:phage baseplate assembly protein W